MGFYNNLILGYKCEEKVAQFLRGKGFQVWNIGNYRLPVDLLVWDENITFWVQVKFRNDLFPICPIWVKRSEILNVWKETDCSVILILEFKEQLYQVHLQGKRIKLGLPRPKPPWHLPIYYLYQRKKPVRGKRFRWYKNLVRFK